MSYRNYSNGYRRGGYNYRRQTHREAVSTLYGGLDEDVRRIFFGLGPASLDRLLEVYERKYGKAKRQYAERTYQNWKSGQVVMSGELSERLLDILPPLLPLETKYYLVAKLWHSYQPKMRIKITVRPDTGIDEAVKRIVDTIEQKKQATIPDSVRGRLQWLAGDDALAAEALLKEVVQREGNILREQTQTQMPEMLRRIESGSGLSITGAKEINIAGTSILIQAEKTPFLRRVFMSNDQPTNSNNLPVRRDQSDRSLAPIQNPNNLLGEAISRLTPEQQTDLMGKAAEEALDLQVKMANANADIDIARGKMDILTEQVRKVAHTPGVTVRGEAEHAGTRLEIRKGCMTCILFVVLPLVALELLVRWVF